MWRLGRRLAIWDACPIRWNGVSESGMGMLREPCLASLWLPRPQSFGCVLLLFVWRFGGEYVGYEKYFLL